MAKKARTQRPRNARKAKVKGKGPRGRPFQKGNSGRPAGSRNKRTVALREWLEQEGARPEQFLAYFMLGKHDEIGMSKSDLTPALRVQAAKELLPYCWPKLSAIEAKIGGDGAQPLRVVIEGFDG